MAKKIKVPKEVFYNPRSSQQTARVCRGLGINLTLKTEKGESLSTSEDALFPFKEHPFVSTLLKYRELQKTIKTYIDRFLEKSIADGMLYPSYNQAIVDSNRLSSNEVHNITKKSEQGTEIRRAFIAPSGYKMIAFDFSQLQLRIIAHYSQDYNLVQAYKNGIDVHKKTADSLGVSRQIGKIINFMLSFGGHARKLQSELLKEGISKTTQECEQYVEQFFVTYSGLKTWIDYIIKFVERNGYAPSLFGFKKPLAYPQNKKERFYFEHCCVNAPIMATESQIVKLAMINVSKKITLPYIHIHDDLTFLLPEHLEQPKLICEIKQAMTEINPLSVPIEVNCKIGDNWGDLHEIE